MPIRHSMTRVLFLVGLVWHGSVHADAFDRAKRAIPVQIGRADLSGFSLRGGAALSGGVGASSATLLRGQASIGKVCGGFDLATSLSEAFESVPELLESLVQNLLGSMPLLVLCYSSPSLCNLTTHFQNIVSSLIQAKYAQCTQVQTAMAYGGLRLRGGAVSQCLEQHANAGTPLNQAMKVCMEQVDSLRLPNGLNGQQLALVQDTLDAAGATQEMRTLASTLLGDVTMRVNNGALGVSQSRPQGAMMARYDAHRAEVSASLDAAVDELRTTGTVNPTTLEQISVPGQALPLAALHALVALRGDRHRYESHLQKLATNLALTRLTWECGEIQEQLASSMESNAQLTDEQRRLLEQRLAALDRDLQQVRAKKRVIEQDLQPAIDGLLREYEAVQRVATEAGLQAPRSGLPVMPYGTQFPAGYGQ